MALQNPTSLLPPQTLLAISAAGIDPTWFVDRQAGLLVAMQDRFDPSLLGLIGLRGDFSGRGTRTIRVAAVDGLGFAERLAAISETGRPQPTGYTLGYTTLTVADYGLAKQETFAEGIIGDPATRLGLDELEARLPASCMATLRYLACVTGATVTANTIGATTTRLSMDDIWTLRSGIISNRGAPGPVRMMIHPTQFNHLSDSARSEPGIERQFVSWLDAAKVNANGAENGVFGDFCGMGIDVGITNDVVLSSGAYKGFAGSPGFMGWGRASASPANLPLPASSMPVYLPEYGVLIWRPNDALGNLTREVMVLQIVGTALGDAAVFYQALVQSIST